MITDVVEKGFRYVHIIQKDPALALATANGFIAMYRKNWVLFEIAAYPQRIEGEDSEDTFVGLKFKPAPTTTG